MKARKQVRLDEQSQEDARRIAERYNLGSVSAAIRFALREVARNVAADAVEKKAADDEQRT